MSSAQNSRAIPIRAIIMILVSLAILFAAVGAHGFLTRNDDPQAALNAQEAKLKDAATAAATTPATKRPVCLIAVGRASLDETTAALTEAGIKPQADAETWPGRPAAPRTTTVYFETGGEAQAKTVAAALSDAPTAARPTGLTVCAGAIAVAVVRK